MLITISKACSYEMFSVQYSDAKKKKQFFSEKKKINCFLLLFFFYLFFFKYGININAQVETTLLWDLFSIYDTFIFIYEQLRILHHCYLFKLEN